MIQLLGRSQDDRFRLENQILELDLIDDIRAASRQMVRELGFMDATIAATDYPPSAVHTILEIGMHGRSPRRNSPTFCAWRKSSVSRMVRKLIDNGELKRDLRCHRRAAQSRCH